MLEKTVHLFNPHPGFKGVMANLPEVMKMAVEKLDGQNNYLENVVSILDPIAKGFGGIIKVAEEYNFICFEYNRGKNETHTCKLLDYN